MHAFFFICTLFLMPCIYMYIYMYMYVTCATSWYARFHAVHLYGHICGYTCNKRETHENQPRHEHDRTGAPRRPSTLWARSPPTSPQATTTSHPPSVTNYMYMHVYTYICMRSYKIYICVYTHVHACIHMNNMYICVYTCVCMWT